LIFSKIDSLHSNAIFNFSWAEPQMKLVTGCGDQTSKLCTLRPSGELHEEQEFFYSASVRSVMFCPGSSGIYNEKIVFILIVMNLYIFITFICFSIF